MLLFKYVISCQHDLLAKAEARSQEGGVMLPNLWVFCRMLSKACRGPNDTAFFPVVGISKEGEIFLF